MKTEPKVIKVASDYHNVLCQLNHTDGCSWQWCTWDQVNENDKYNVKTRHYHMAEKIIALVGMENALAIAKIIKER